MEMQLFILGHIILLAICLGVGATLDTGDDRGDSIFVALGGLGIFLVFIPLEIVYWVLHWNFVS